MQFQFHVHLALCSSLGKIVEREGQELAVRSHIVYIRDITHMCNLHK